MLVMRLFILILFLGIIMYAILAFSECSLDAGILERWGFELSLAIY
jgi:hypothetical protein